MASTYDTSKPLGPDNPQIVTHLSWGDYLRHLEETPAVPGTGNGSHNHGASWSGTDTFEQAMELARNGWKEGTDRVSQAARRLETRLLDRIVKEDIKYDVEGRDFDLARALSGEPEHWVGIEEQPITSLAGDRHVQVAVCLSASGGVSAEAMLAKGAAAASLVTLLEQGDKQVELWTVSSLSGDYARSGEQRKPSFVSLVRVKAYDQPLDLARIAFALAHPASFRRLGFAAFERGDVRVCGNYGSKYPADYVPNGTSIYIGAVKLWNAEVDWQDPASVESWVIAELAKQGILLRDEEV